MKRWGIFVASLTLASVAGWAQGTPSPLRIGVLADMSSTTADLGGQGSVIAAQLAVEDNGGTVLGRKIEVISGDTQNKPDVSANLVRRWFDTEGVDAIAESHGEWDLYKILRTLPGEALLPPVSETVCPSAK